MLAPANLPDAVAPANLRALGTTGLLLMLGGLVIIGREPAPKDLGDAAIIVVWPRSAR